MDVGNGKGEKCGQHKPEMNVTPLVDVVLVLLIIFMVVAPMLNEHFWVHVPDKPDEDAEPAQPAAGEGEPPIVVNVTQEGAIRINQEVFSDTEFPARLRRMLVARGERKVYFDANDNAPFERAVEVMDLARGGGAAHIAVMTAPLE